MAKGLKLGDVVERLKQGVSDTFRATGNALGELYSTVKNAVVSALGSIQAKLNDAVAAIKRIDPVILRTILTGVQAVTTLTKPLASLIQRIPAAIAALPGKISASLANLPSKVSSAVQKLISNLQSTLTKSLATLNSMFKGFQADIRKIPSSVGSSVSNTFKGLLNSTTNTLKSLINALPKSVQGLINASFNSLKTSLNSLKITLNNSAFSQLSSIARSLYSTLSSSINSAVNGVSSSLRGLLNSASSTASNVSSNLSRIASSVSASISSAGNSARAALDGIFNGIRSNAQSVQNAVKNSGDEITRGIQGIPKTIEGQKILLDRIFQSATTSYQDGIKAVSASFDDAVKGLEPITKNLAPNIQKTLLEIEANASNILKNNETIKTASQSVDDAVKNIGNSAKAASQSIDDIAKSSGGLGKLLGDFGSAISKSLPILADLVNGIQISNIESTVNRIENTLDKVASESAAQAVLFKLQSQKLEQIANALVAIDTVLKSDGKAQIDLTPVLNAIGAIQIPGYNTLASDVAEKTAQKVQQQLNIPKTVQQAVKSGLNESGTNKSYFDTQFNEAIKAITSMGEGLKNSQQNVAKDAVNQIVKAIPQTPQIVSGVIAGIKIPQIDLKPIQQQLNTGFGALQTQINTKIPSASAIAAETAKQIKVPTVDLKPIQTTVDNGIARISLQVKDLQAQAGKPIDFTQVISRINTAETNLKGAINNGNTALSRDVNTATNAARQATAQATEVYKLLGGDQLKNGFTVIPEDLIKQEGVKQYDDLGNANKQNTANSWLTLMPMLITPLFFRAGFQRFPYFAKDSLTLPTPKTVPIADAQTQAQYNRKYLQDQIGVPTPYKVRTPDGQETTIAHKHTTSAIEEVSAQAQVLLSDVDALERMISGVAADLQKISGIVLRDHDKLDLIIEELGIKYDEVKRSFPTAVSLGKQNLFDFLKPGELHYTGFKRHNYTDSRELMQRILWDTQITRTSFSQQIKDPANIEIPGVKEGLGKSDSDSNWTKFVKTINNPPNLLKGARLNEPKIEEFDNGTFKDTSISETKNLLGQTSTQG